MNKPKRFAKEPNCSIPLQRASALRKVMKTVIWTNCKVRLLCYYSIKHLAYRDCSEQNVGAKNDIASANTTVQQAKVKVSHLKKELSTLEPKLRKAENQNKAVLAEMGKCEADIHRYETELSKCQFDPERESTLRREKSALQDDLQRHQEVNNSLLRSL